MATSAANSIPSSLRPIILAVRTLYTSKASDKQFAQALTHMSDRVQFDDPLSQVKTKTRYIAQFQALRSLFKEYYPITFDVIQATNERIVIDSKMHWSSLGTSLEFRQITFLKLEPSIHTGGSPRILHHEDVWVRKVNKENVLI